MQLRILKKRQIWLYTMAVAVLSVTIAQLFIQGLYLWFGDTVFTYRYMAVAAVIIPVFVALPVAYSMGRVLYTLAHTQQTLTRLAETDGLTGLINRRSFFDRGEALLTAAKNASFPVALMILDADHFKQINHGYGHATGDKALKFIADAFNSVARETDLIARVGGEEFAVLAPDTDHQEARLLAKRLIDAVCEQPLLCDRAILEISVSCGFADTSHGYDLDRLYKIADMAMYQAKSDGRNRAVQAA
ncbi:MAG: GGDEF domain-containing protein [Proteobacteria bacterium]|nr:GGDEF domain-containing protein [Pseudomonadota bacterium]